MGETVLKMFDIIVLNELRMLLWKEEQIEQEKSAYKFYERLDRNKEKKERNFTVC